MTYVADRGSRPMNIKKVDMEKPLTEELKRIIEARCSSAG